MASSLNSSIRFVISVFCIWITFLDTSFLVAQANNSTSPLADKIYHSGKVVTVDSDFSIRQAIALKADRIIAVGNTDEIKKLAGPKTLMVDLKGKFLMPGMVDCHCHPDALGKRGLKGNDWFNAGGTKDFEELVERVRNHVKTLKPGKWIIGGGWNQENWPGKELPIHDKLSAVSPNNPIFFYRHGGNSAFANAKALEIAGITKETKDPKGGKIYRKENGEPTGFVVNMGNNMIKKHFPNERKPDQYYQRMYINAARQANEVGLTGWHDAGTGPGTIRIYHQLAKTKKLTVRANVMLQNPRLETVEKMVKYFRQHRSINPTGDFFLQIRSVKVYFDGAIGSRGAKLFRDYSDEAGNTGVYEVPPRYLQKIAEAGLQAGMQICPHAIGTKANHELLNAFESALKIHPVKDHRFRSEHAELIHPLDVSRFNTLGIIPSVQPIHCTSDMVFMADRLGKKRAETVGSPWRSLIDSGSKPACGSDFMVESHRPLWGIYAAVTRQNHDGTPAGGWVAAQRMTRQEAIKGYTIWAAESAFLEEHLGSLEKGKLADFVVLDTDLLTCKPQAIFNAKVLETVVGGKTVFTAKTKVGK